jgi:hypothetical protein
MFGWAKWHILPFGWLNQLKHVEAKVVVSGCFKFNSNTAHSKTIEDNK